MRSIIQRADASGSIRIGDANHGFFLSPAFERSHLGTAFVVNGEPGDFPVTVRALTGGEAFELLGSAEVTTGGVAGGFTLETLDPNSCWHIVLLTEPGERYTPSGKPGVVMGLVQGADVAPYGTPTPVLGLRVPVRSCFTSMRVHADAGLQHVAVARFDEYDRQLEYQEIDTTSATLYVDVACDGTRGYLRITNVDGIGNATVAGVMATIEAY